MKKRIAVIVTAVISIISTLATIVLATLWILAAQVDKFVFGG